MEKKGVLMVRILSDSTCDLGLKRAEELGVEILPLTVCFGDEAYLDYVELEPAEFFDKLRKAKQLPTTSQLNPDFLAKSFQAIVDKGDDAVGIFISSELSGTYQSACLAREMVTEPERVYLVDSRTATIVQGILVMEAARRRDAGDTAAEIQAYLQRLIPKMRLYAVIDTLKYLQMGGRISAASAAIGGVLGIHPIISIIDGKVVSLGKARGWKAAIQALEDYVKKDDIDKELTIVFGDCEADEAKEQCKERLQPYVQGAVICTSGIGSVVGTYVGPGAVGIAYFVK